MGLAQAHLDELFGAQASAIDVTVRQFNFRYRTPEHWLEIFKTFYGPVLKAFAALDAAAQPKLAADLMALIGRFNRAQDGTLVAPERLPRSRGHQAVSRLIVRRWKVRSVLAAPWRA